jgi:hypothetical protein
MESEPEYEMESEPEYEMEPEYDYNDDLQPDEDAAYDMGYAELSSDGEDPEEEGDDNPEFEDSEFEDSEFEDDE